MNAIANFSFAFLNSINAFFAGAALGFTTLIIWPQIIALFLAAFILVIVGAMVGEKGKIKPATTAELIGSIGMFVVAVNILLRYLSIV